MKRSLSLILLCTMMAIFLTGCWDSKDTEILKYVSGLGIDHQDGKYEVYIQIFSFSNIAKQENWDQSMKQPVWIARGVGRTVREALEDIYYATQQRIYWGHIDALIFSESALKKGIDLDLDFFNRFRELRYTALAYATDESIEKLFTLKPVTGLSAYYTILHHPEARNHQYSILPTISVRELLLGMKETGNTVMIPKLSINRNTWQIDENPHDEMVLNGGYFMHKGKWRGMLTLDQLKGYRWMSEKTIQSSIRLMKGDNIVASLVLENPRITLETFVKNDKPYFNIHVSYGGKISELMTDDVNEFEIVKLAKEKLAEEIRQTYHYAIRKNLDIYQVEEMFYRWKNKEWKRLVEDDDFGLTEDSLNAIHVDLQIVSTGKYKLQLK